MELLVTRARAAAPSFALTEANAQDVAGLCRRLGGLPLALELAAPRLRVLSPAELGARIETTIDALGSYPADAPRRQRSLRAAFDWTMSVLPQDTGDVFLALGSFSTPWTLSDAESLCGGETLDDLAVLVDAALVRRTTSGEFDMPDALRTYARELLATAPASGDVRRRHAELFEQHGLAIHDRYYFDVLGTTRRAARALSELLVAIDWARDAERALHARVVAAAVTPKLAIRAGAAMGADLRLASQRADRDDVATRTLIECGLALDASSAGDPIGAITHADAAAVLAMRCGQPPRWVFHARMFEVWMRIIDDDGAGATERLDQVIADLEPDFDDAMRRYVRTTLANLLDAQGRFDEAEPLLAELATSLAPPDLPTLLARHSWALLAFRRGEYAEAAERCRDALLRVGDEPYIPTNHALLLETFGAALSAEDPESGLALMACAGARLGPRDKGPFATPAGHAEQQRRAIERLGDERAHAAARRGAALPFQEGCALAVATGLTSLTRS